MASIAAGDPALVELLASAAGQVQQAANQTFYFRMKVGGSYEKSLARMI